MKKKFWAGLATGLLMIGIAGEVLADSMHLFGITSVPGVTVESWISGGGSLGGIASAQYLHYDITNTSGLPFNYFTVDLGMGDVNLTNSTNSFMFPSLQGFHSTTQWSVTLNDIEYGSVSKVWAQMPVYYVPIPGEDVYPTPEPATMLLMGTGLAGLIGARRKKKK